MSVHNWTVDEMRAAMWTEEEIAAELAERERLGLPKHGIPDPAVMKPIMDKILGRKSP